ncbi:MAG TPA: phage tail protein [Arachnia sp.]|nr:phage tail protein [Arachnia sp.]HMT85309.1 phage tail protein [Arachnia sp.]
MMDTTPLPAFNFFVMMFPTARAGAAAPVAAVAAVVGGFTECSGLESEIAVEDRLVGGVNDRVYRFPGRASFPSIVLKRGVAFSDDLYLWHESFLKGEGAARDGLIVLANESRMPIKSWRFEAGLPKKWSGPVLNAQSSALAVETLEIAHRRLTLAAAPGQLVAAAGAALGI